LEEINFNEGKRKEPEKSEALFGTWGAGMGGRRHVAEGHTGDDDGGLEAELEEGGVQLHP